MKYVRHTLNIYYGLKKNSSSSACNGADGVSNGGIVHYSYEKENK